MSENQEITEAAISAAASKVTYAGSATVGFGWLATNEAAIVMGIFIGLAGLLVNIIFKWLEHQQREKYLQAQLEKHGQE